MNPIKAAGNAVSSVVNTVSEALSGSKGGKDKASPIETSQVVPITTKGFYSHTESINPSLWDKYTPYQLLIVEVVGDGADVTYKQTPWRYTLPISPQELNLDMPIATSLQATLTGVSIQHGGAPFRNITLQGTTGIAPLIRHRAADIAGGNETVRDSIVRAGKQVFAGTIKKVEKVAAAVNKVIGNKPELSVHKEQLGTNTQNPDTLYAKGTGYYQMRLMERFIESYVAIKTQGAAGVKNVETMDPKRLRLAFCMWKDQSVYLVEPLQFTKRRSASAPMEYTFSLTLKAYKRVALDKGGPAPRSPHSFVARDPNLISDAFNRLRAAREALDGVSDVLESVVSDPVNLLSEGLRETSLFLASVGGVAAAISDFPTSLQDEAFNSVRDNWKTLRSTFASTISGDFDKAMANGTSLDKKQMLEFKNKIGKTLTPESIKLSPLARRQMQQEVNRVKNLGRHDFEKTRDLINATATTFAERIGASHDAYTTTYNRPEPAAERTPTSTEMDVLFSLNDAAIVLDHLAVSSQIDPPTPTSLEYVAGLAEASGIAFQIPTSKFAVPFPYGMSLEQLSLLYLGDANRWHEIATLNGLRAPYVDEEGFSVSLISNGDRNTVVVADKSNLFQGQTVWLSANGVKREKRHIQKIETLSSTQHIITLDGNQDLQRFTTLNLAILEAFLPGTVNSQQIIYIPSQEEAAVDPRTKAVPGVDEFDPLLQISGIDLLLTPDGDLAITPDGDVRLAYGLTNVVQTVKIALGTPRGSLLQHPNFGLSLPIGGSTADVDPEDVIRAAEEQFAADPMFSGVRSAIVAKDGPVLRITLDVGIAGTSQFIPITVVFGG